MFRALGWRAGASPAKLPKDLVAKPPVAPAGLPEAGSPLSHPGRCRRGLAQAQHWHTCWHICAQPVLGAVFAKGLAPAPLADRTTCSSMGAWAQTDLQGPSILMDHRQHAMGSRWCASAS